jgi:hypothetical protein
VQVLGGDLLDEAVFVVTTWAQSISHSIEIGTASNPSPKGATASPS